MIEKCVMCLDLRDFRSSRVLSDIDQYLKGTLLDEHDIVLFNVSRTAMFNSTKSSPFLQYAIHH